MSGGPHPALGRVATQERNRENVRRARPDRWYEDRGRGTVP